MGGGGSLLNVTPANELVQGSKAVTVAGTAEQLASDTQCRYVTIKAEVTNAGDIFIGDSSIDNTSLPFAAGQGIEVSVDNLSKIWIDASVSGDGVFFHYVK